MIAKARHLFAHHTSNNHKARLLHVEGFFALFCIVIFSSFFVRTLSGKYLNLPAVLGFSTTITAQETVNETNKVRTANGLSSLVVNKQLVQAALAKGTDMCREQYWAHFSPTGTSPWSFVKNAGYEYSIAGENLARDFADTQSMMNAWIASPTHKANVLHTRYTDIGVAVVSCTLLGSDTALVVQMFGTPANAAAIGKIPSVGTSVQGATVAQDTTVTLDTHKSYMLTPLQVQKSIAISIILLLVCVLTLDMWLVEKKNVVRVSSRSLGHFFFCIGILCIVLLMRSGATL